MALPDGCSISVMNDDELAVLDDWAADEGWNPGLSDLSLARKTDPDAFIALRQGETLAGAGTVFIEQHWNYPAPVFIGDTIRAEATVTWVHASKPVAKLDFRVANQDGVEVLNGDAMIYQATPEAAPLT